MRLTLGAVAAALTAALPLPVVSVLRAGLTGEALISIGLAAVWAGLLGGVAVAQISCERGPAVLAQP